jgi:hypothetical protein
LDLDDNVRKGIQLKVINVLKKWVLERFRDFNDIMQLNVKNFGKILTLDGNQALAQQIESAIDRMSAEVQSKNDRLLNVSNGLFLKVKHVGKKNESPQQFLARLKAPRLAESLTLIEYRIFRNIQPPELLGKAWSKSDGKIRSPNVMTLINRFNTVSSWVASTILWCEKLKERAKMYSKMIKIMRHLYEIKNYNCAMAVLAGLNNSAIHRLRLTQAEVKQKTKDVRAACPTYLCTICFANPSPKMQLIDLCGSLQKAIVRFLLFKLPTNFAVFCSPSHSLPRHVLDRHVRCCSPLFILACFCALQFLTTIIFRCSPALSSRTETWTTLRV